MDPNVILKTIRKNVPAKKPPKKQGKNAKFSTFEISKILVEYNNFCVYNKVLKISLIINKSNMYFQNKF